jgi:hypothetical protein
MRGESHDHTSSAFRDNPSFRFVKDLPLQELLDAMNGYGQAEKRMRMVRDAVIVVQLPGRWMMCH